MISFFPHARKKFDAHLSYCSSAPGMSARETMDSNTLAAPPAPGTPGDLEDQEVQGRQPRPQHPHPIQPGGEVSAVRASQPVAQQAGSR